MCSESRCAFVSGSVERSTPSIAVQGEDRGPVMNVGIYDTSLTKLIYISRQLNLALALDLADCERDIVRSLKRL